MNYLWAAIIHVRLIKGYQTLRTATHRNNLIMFSIVADTSNDYLWVAIKLEVSLVAVTSNKLPLGRHQLLGINLGAAIDSGRHIINKPP